MCQVRDSVSCKSPRQMHTSSAEILISLAFSSASCFTNWHICSICLSTCKHPERGQVRDHTIVQSAQQVLFSLQRSTASGSI